MVGVLSIALSYLLGSIPFSFVVAKFKGVDVRTQGTGNVGAGNVIRQVGFAYGALAGVLDVGKGSLAVLLAEWLGSAEFFWILAGAAAVLGHIWPIFLKFKGGAGLATTMGAILALSPLLGVICSIVIFALPRILRNKYAGTLGVMFAAPPLAHYLFRLSPTIVWGIEGLFVLRLISDYFYYRKISR
ncbi:MAG: glycerol-3-phosphate acyltransferase [bacterium]